MDLIAECNQFAVGNNLVDLHAVVPIPLFT